MRHTLSFSQIWFTIDPKLSFFFPIKI
ncbi:tryptophanase leader peptide [Otariodibacter oris]